MDFKTLEKHWSAFLIISFCSIVLFIFFLTLSMIFYPDGLNSTGIMVLTDIPSGRILLVI